ncbi:uncharacterized protein EI97DRAFT_142266 [Westerdykella ornata]|uniref:Uncharacterized protein n=1 Tax=Westerdykella ornata TaxID=318751 RepID=A0A6A6JCQ6_WESOR|nr:uncharacterized protein EI97DRAFT_142266 [Westerdykella ornata]KAF2274004.1 hypothetical protein EI97DRAFT_142266 [Westerdykella ornata]
MGNDQRRQHSSNSGSSQQLNYKPTRPNYGDIPTIVIHPPSDTKKVVNTSIIADVVSSSPAIPSQAISPGSPWKNEGNRRHSDPRSRLRRHSMHGFDREITKEFTPHGQDEKGASSSTRPRTKQSPVPAEAVFVDERPEGWVMKTRTIYRPALPRTNHNVDIVMVYIYSHSQCTRDGEDADIVFLTPNEPSNGAEGRLSPLPRRARTAFPSTTETYSKSSPAAPKNDTLESAVKDIRSVERHHLERPERHVNWLNRMDMLPRHFPESR